jgi:hypothetical protein
LSSSNKRLEPEKKSFRSRRLQSRRGSFHPPNIHVQMNICRRFSASKGTIVRVVEFLKIQCQSYLPEASTGMQHRNAALQICCMQHLNAALQICCMQHRNAALQVCCKFCNGNFSVLKFAATCNMVFS